MGVETENNWQLILQPKQLCISWQFIEPLASSQQCAAALVTEALLSIVIFAGQVGAARSALAATCKGSRKLSNSTIIKWSLRIGLRLSETFHEYQLKNLPSRTL